MRKTKEKSNNIFKRWWILTNPNKLIFAGQIFFYACYTILLSVITIFAARTINCMYAKDWNGAFFNLAIELITIIMRNVLYHVQYIFYTKELSHIRYVVAKKVYNKILSCKSSEFNNVSKEKITNIALNNMGNLSEFPDAIASFIAYSIQVAFTLITVFTSNYLAGIIVTALGVANFFAYYFFNKKLGKLMLERHEKKDDMFKSYSKIIDGKSIINELQGKEKYEGELINNVKGFSKAYSKYQMITSCKTNLYYACWNVVVYLIAALMLFYVSNGSLDIAVYLIIVPYLTTCTDKLNTLFDKTNNIENMRVDVDRVNLILNLSDEELINYGNLNTVSDKYNLGFINVSCKNTTPNNHELRNINLTFKTNGINVIKGEKGSGKRHIFDLLRRYEKPTKGKILLDNLNLYDYNEKTFKTHINYCSSHPTFINGSIKENLELIDTNFENVLKVCKEIGIKKEIEKLPQGFNTQILDIDNSSLLFLLGLTRALLSNCKILMIYEIPQDAADSLRLQIIDILTNHNIDKTIILFTHSNDYNNIADVSYLIDNGIAIEENPNTNEK